MSMFNNRFLDPVVDAGAAPKPEVKPEPKGEEKPAPTPAPRPVNLADKVKIGDDEYTVAELGAEVQQSLKFKESVANILRADTPVEQKAANMRLILTNLGSDPQEIENYIQANFKSAPTPKGEEGGNEVVNKKLEAVESELKRQKLEVLDGALTNTTKAVLDKNEKVAKFIQAAKRMGGDEQAEKAAAIIGKNLRKATIEAMHLKKAQTGQNATKDWIPDLMDAVLDDVLENVGGAVIGDPNKLGRSSETDTGISEFLSAKPVEAPTFTPKMGRGDVDKAVSSWLLDGLVRDANKVGTGPSRV